MALNITLKQESGINLNCMSLLAEEFFGVVTEQTDYSLSLSFPNHSHGQNFRKTIFPYFSGQYANV